MVKIEERDACEFTGAARTVVDRGENVVRWRKEVVGLEQHVFIEPIE